MLPIKVLLHRLVDQWEQDLLPMSGELWLFQSIGPKELCENILSLPLEVRAPVVQLKGHFLAPQTPQFDTGHVLRRFMLVHDNVLKGILDPRPGSQLIASVVEPLKGLFQWSW